MSRLTLREFLDAGYALFVEEFQRYGDIITAVSKTDAAFGIETEEKATERKAMDNAAAIQQLGAQLKGVSGLSGGQISG